MAIQPAPSTDVVQSEPLAGDIQQSGIPQQLPQVESTGPTLPVVGGQQQPQGRDDVNTDGIAEIILELSSRKASAEGGSPIEAASSNSNDLANGPKKQSESKSSGLPSSSETQSAPPSREAMLDQLLQQQIHEQKFVLDDKIRMLYQQKSMMENNMRQMHEQLIIMDNEIQMAEQHKNMLDHRLSTIRSAPPPSMPRIGSEGTKENGILSEGPPPPPPQQPRPMNTGSTMQPVPLQVPLRVASTNAFPPFQHRFTPSVPSDSAQFMFMNQQAVNGSGGNPWNSPWVPQATQRSHPRIRRTIDEYVLPPTPSTKSTNPSPPSSSSLKTPVQNHHKHTPRKRARIALPQKDEQERPPRDDADEEISTANSSIFEGNAKDEHAGAMKTATRKGKRKSHRHSAPKKFLWKPELTLTLSELLLDHIKEQDVNGSLPLDSRRQIVEQFKERHPDYLTALSSLSMGSLQSEIGRLVKLCSQYFLPLYENLDCDIDLLKRRLILRFPECGKTSGSSYDEEVEHYAEKEAERLKLSYNQVVRYFYSDCEILMNVSKYLKKSRSYFVSSMKSKDNILKRKSAS